MSKQLKKETTSCGCCVFRILNNVPQILLVRPFPDRDAWGIPKGHLDEGETLEACALRETLEEAGINVILQERLSPVKCVYKTERKTVESWLAYQADTTEPFAADGENVEVSWFNLDEIPNIHVYQRPLIHQASDKIKAYHLKLSNELSSRNS